MEKGSVSGGIKDLLRIEGLTVFFAQFICIF